MGKKGRKKAVERIKAIDKEINEIAKRENGIDVLINIGMKKVSYS
jgi:hypothetical protein